MIDDAVTLADEKARPVSDASRNAGMNDFAASPFAPQGEGSGGAPGGRPKRLPHKIAGYARRHPLQMAVASVAGFALLKTLPKLRQR
jgi:hypothetical protein